MQCRTQAGKLDIHFRKRPWNYAFVTIYRIAYTLNALFKYNKIPPIRSYNMHILNILLFIFEIKCFGLLKGNPEKRF